MPCTPRRRPTCQNCRARAHNTTTPTPTGPSWRANTATPHSSSSNSSSSINPPTRHNNHPTCSPTHPNNPPTINNTNTSNSHNNTNTHNNNNTNSNTPRQPHHPTPRSCNRDTTPTAQAHRPPIVVRTANSSSSSIHRRLGRLGRCRICMRWMGGGRGGDRCEVDVYGSMWISI